MWCDMCGGKIGRDKYEELENNVWLKQYHRCFLENVCMGCYYMMLEFDKTKSVEAFQGIIFADTRVENLFGYHPTIIYTDEIIKMIDDAVGIKRIDVVYK